MEIKSLSIKELKSFHKSVREKIDCALPDTEPKNKWMRAINPNYNQVKAEGIVILKMIDEELELRKYDPEKLFKNYTKNKYLNLINTI